MALNWRTALALLNAPLSLGCWGIMAASQSPAGSTGTLSVSMRWLVSDDGILPERVKDVASPNDAERELLDHLRNSARFSQDAFDPLEQIERRLLCPTLPQTTMATMHSSDCLSAG